VPTDCAWPCIFVEALQFDVQSKRKGSARATHTSADFITDTCATEDSLQAYLNLIALDRYRKLLLLGAASHGVG